MLFGGGGGAKEGPQFRELHIFVPALNPSAPKPYKPNTKLAHL